VSKVSKRGKEKEAEKERVGLRELARLRLRAHFAEDRNELLSEDAIRIIGGETPPAISKTKP
jgi:hypothetical protein